MPKKKASISVPSEPKKKSGKLVKAVFFKDSRNPKCPDCHYSLEVEVEDYGVEDNKFFFVNTCQLCTNKVKYFTDNDMYPIKTKIVERKTKK